jgi:uncharacterized protein YcbK (DUF882 family)
MKMSATESGLAMRRASRRDVLRSSLGLAGGIAAAGLLVSPTHALAALMAPRSPRELSFLNLHTGERLKAEYWSNGQYHHDALSAINHLLRDHVNNQVHTIDPGLLDLIHVLHDKVRSADPFHVICGYRSPETNERMHEFSCGVAKNSMHIQGKAIDIRLPGTGLHYLQNAALSLQGGGVGYYPKDDFVHVDTGKVRRW